LHLIVFTDKAGGVAPESVNIKLLKFKYLSCLYYDLEACKVNKSFNEILELILIGVIKNLCNEIE